MQIRDIKQYLSQPIDRFQLEIELEKYPFVFQEAMKDLANLRMAMGMAKQALDTTQYQLDLAIRQEYEKSGKKSTEGIIAAEVKTNQDYLDAFENYLKAKRDFDELDMLREVFMAREASYKMEVQLFGSQYWSLQTAEKSVPKAAVTTTSKFKQREINKE